VQQQELLAALKALHQGELELLREHQLQLQMAKEIPRAEEDSAKEIAALQAEQREQEQKMRDECAQIQKYILAQQKEEKAAMLREGPGGEAAAAAMLAQADSADADLPSAEDFTLEPPPLPPMLEAYGLDDSDAGVSTPERSPSPPPSRGTSPPPRGSSPSRASKGYGSSGSPMRGSRHGSDDELASSAEGTSP
jgi:hypothetical protein